MIAKRICAFEEGKVKFEKFEITPLKDNEVLIKTQYSTISAGTELAWLNHLENTPGEYPYYPGYSCCGIIIEKGEKVYNFELGDLVVCNFSHSTHFKIQSEKCIKIQSSQNLKAVSAFRLASISLQGIRKAGIQIGDRVAIIGLGAIGNLAAQLAIVAGALEVVGFDYLDSRREVAEKCNIITNRPNDIEKLENYFDIVIEASGSPRAVNPALKIIKPLGTFIALGSTRGSVNDINFYRDIHRKGITIIGAHEMHRAQCENDQFGYFKTNAHDEQTVIKLEEQGKINLGILITKTVDITDAQKTYEDLIKNEEENILVNFKY